MATDPPVDFLIFAPLQEEREAVLALLPGAKRLPPTDSDVLIYHSAQLPIRLSDGQEGSYHLVVVSPVRMGRVAAATAATKAIERWLPRYALIVGIAGGCANSVGLGDVIVADQVVDYELQKVTQAGSQVRYFVHPTDPRLLNAVQHLGREGWDERPTSRPSDGKPSVHVGPIATGDKVAAVSSFIEEHRSHWPKLIGIEMEAGGVAAAAFEATSKPGVLMIRGVSDRANQDKGTESVERWRRYACEIAASYMLSLLQSGPAPFSKMAPAASPTSTSSSGTLAEAQPAHSPTNTLIDFRIERARHEGFFGRLDVLAEIDRLIADPQVSRGWVLITGGPGQGKSALLNRWLSLREESGVCVPAHFLLRGVQDWARPSTVIRSLCAQLAVRFPVHDAEESAPLESRMLRLLMAISAQDLSPKQRRLVIALDGIDEAQGEYDDDNLLPHFLPHALPPGVFVVCTSRPTYPNLEWLHGRSEPVRRIALDEPTWRESNEEACRAFWKYHAQRFSPPLSDAFIQSALQRSDGNLLYAVKLRERLLDLPPEQRSTEHIPRGLQGMLEQIWHQLLAQQESVRRLAVAGLTTLCIAREALPLSAVALINGWSHLEDRDAFLRVSRSFLRAEPSDSQAEERYRPYHEAFREFVLKKLGADAILQAHRLLSACISVWPPVSVSLSMRSYGLRHSLTHLCEGQQWKQLSELCRDVRFLTVRCREYGIASVEDGLHAAATRCLDQALAQEIASLHRALHDESHWLWRDPEALPTQLYNRLRCAGWSENQLLNRLRWESLPLLRLRHPIQRRPDHSIRTFTGHDGGVDTCVFTPDGSHAVTGAHDSLIKVWECATGREIATLSVHTASVGDLAMSADGRRVLSAGRDGALILWDLIERRGMLRLQTEHGPYAACKFLPGEDLAVCATECGAIEIWNLKTATRESCVVHSGHRRWISTLAVTTEGRQFITGAFDDTAKVWNVSPLREIATLRGHSNAVRSCSVTPDGKRLITAAMDSTIRVWDLRTAQELRCLKGHSGWVTAIAVLPDGRHAVSGGTDDVLKLWDLETGDCLATYSGHASSVIACAVSSNGQRILTGCADGSVKLWELHPRPRDIEHLGHHGRVLCCAISSDGDRLLSGDVDGRLLIWDLATGTQQQELTGHTNAVLDCKFSADGALAASASSDETVRLWNIQAGEERSVLHGHTAFVRRCLFDQTGEYLISSSDDKTLRVWNVSSGQQHQRFRVLGSAPLAWSHDQTFLFSGGDNRSITVWDWEHHQPIGYLSGHTDTVWSLVAARDGQTLVTTSADRTARLWDLDQLNTRKVLAGHTDMIAGCALIGNGSVLATVSDDKTLKLWSVQSGACLHTLYGSAPFSSIATQGNLLCVGDESGAIWPLDYRSSDEQSETSVAVQHARPTLASRELRERLRKRYERLSQAAREANAVLLSRMAVAHSNGDWKELIVVAAQLASGEISDDEKLALGQRLWRAADLLVEENPEVALQGLELLIDLAEQLPNPPEKLLAEAMMRRMRPLTMLERHDDSYRALDAVADRFQHSTNPDVHIQVSAALLLQAQIAQIRDLAPLRILMNLVRRFGGSTDPKLRQAVLLGLFTAKEEFQKREEWEQVLAVCHLIHTKFKDIASLREAIRSVPLDAGNALAHLNRREEALGAFDAVIASCSPENGSTETEENQRLWSTAMWNRASMLSELGRREEASAALSSLERFAGSSDPYLAENAAGALFRKGIDLLKNKELINSLSVLERLNTDLADAQHPGLIDLAMQSLYNTAVIQRDLGRHKTARQTFRVVADRFKEETEHSRALIATSLFNLGALCQSNGLPKRALRTYDELVERFKDCPEKEVRQRVQAALHNKAQILEQLGKRSQLMDLIEQGLQHSQSTLDELNLDETAKYLFTKALKQGEGGDFDSAIATCDELLARFGSDTTPAVLEAVARTLVHKGYVLAMSGQLDAAHQTYDEVIKRFRDSSDEALQERVVRAHLNQGGGLLARQRYAEAIEVYDVLARQVVGRTKPHIVSMAAQALANRAEALYGLERVQEALSAYEDVVRLYGEHPDDLVKEQVAIALYNRADTLMRQRRPKDAILDLYSITERLRDAPSEPLLRLQRMAQRRLNDLLK